MELYRLTVHELSDLLKSREISCKETVQSIIGRIKELDGTIQAYITLTEEQALKKASDIDDHFSEERFSESSLSGIPVALKDNICTKNIKTTCSSKMLQDFISPYNATVVDKLEEKGSIIIGKTNMDEFAMGSSTEKSAFFKTKNPWNIETVPGGSSGGSAAAVAADEAVYALGSDTGGSVRLPAAFCGVVGLKPTYGSVSRYGLISLASSLDQIGVITRDVTDCAIVMNTIYGQDPNDSTTVDFDMPDFIQHLINNVKGLKIGLPKEYFAESVNEDVRNSVLQAVETLKSLGAEYGEVSLPHIGYSLPTYYALAMAEASSSLARYDGIRYGYSSDDYEDLTDLYKKSRSEGFGSEVKRRIILGTYVLNSDNYESCFVKAQKVRTLINKDFAKALEKFDVLISPTTPTTAFKIGAKRDPVSMYYSDIYTIPANLAGLPAITIPCGFSQGLPIGLQFIGRPFDEKTLIRAAYTFEQNTDYHNKRPEVTNR